MRPGMPYTTKTLICCGLDFLAPGTLLTCTDRDHTGWMKFKTADGRIVELSTVAVRAGSI